MILYVRINGVGTGTDASIGMHENDLKWVSSAESTGTWAVGFIDEKSVTGVAGACNITTGGTLGGFDGDVSIDVISSAVISALVTNAINLVGKSIFIAVGFDNIASNGIRRYTGKVGSWAVSNEITLNIVARSVDAFDLKVIPSVTITKEMALGVADSSAIGKSITTTYGNICDFPLVSLPSDNSFFALSLIPSQNEGGLTLDASSPRLDGVSSMIDSSGKYRGALLMNVIGKYQEIEGISNTWIALSYNGKKAFTQGSSIVDSLKKVFIGMSIKIVKGTGKGTVYKIINLEWASHDLGDVSLGTIWFQIDEPDYNAIEGSGGFSTDWDDNQSSKYLRSASGPFDASARKVDEHFIASYQYKEARSSISFVEICQGQNLFFVSKDCSINESTLISYSKDSNEVKKVSIPDESIEVVFSGKDWNLVRINVGASVSNDVSSFTFSSDYPIETRIREFTDSNSTYGYRVGEFHYTTSDGFDDYQNVPDLGLTCSAAIDSAYQIDYLIATFNHFIIPINGKILGLDLSSENIKLSAVPSFRYDFVSDPSSVQMYAETFFTINVYVISEGNTVIGLKTFTSKKMPSTSGVFFILVDTVNRVVSYGDGVDTSTENDKETFSNIESTLDVSDLLNASNASSIRYIYISVSLSRDIDSGDIYMPPTTVTKLLKKAHLYISNSISKDKLYLQSTRVNSTPPTCPASLVKSIATSNGISIDTNSFNLLETLQHSYYSYPSFIYNGQYQPTAKTSISDCLSDIAKQSLTALYVNTLGVMLAKSVNTEVTPTIEFIASNVDKGTMSVSKPSGGYRYTDFTFDIKKNNYQETERLFVNTDSTLISFPLESAALDQGIIFNSSTGWTFNTCQTDYANKVFSVYARCASTERFPALIFTIGTRVRLYSIIEGFEANATITAMALDILCPLGYSGICLGFTLDSDASEIITLESLKVIAVAGTWTDYISGTFVSDYTTAKNIWDHAQEARLSVGVQSVMPSDTITLTSPIWGDDDRALMQWVLQTVIYASRDKTIIKWTSPMTASTSALWIMDCVSFAFGPYSGSPTKGFIIDVRDDYENGKIEFTIMTIVQDSDVLILNENYAQADLTIDESTNDIINHYNEGDLA